MKLYYYNDESFPVQVYLNGLGQDKLIATLNPMSGKMIEYELPHGAVPYIKKWPNYVMISYIEKASVSQFE